MIDFYRIYEKKRGKKESTIRGEALNTASFLHQMQQRGAQCLDAITEEDVLSFFLAEDGSLQRSCSYKKSIAAVFKAGLNWKAAQCRKVLSFLPVLRENRKNIQYLTQDEVRLLFSSGIRTNEVRLLLRENVDLKRGILDIQYSKGHDQHYIVLHDSMLEIMRRWAVWASVRQETASIAGRWMKNILVLVFLENYIDFFIRTAYNISEQRNLLDLSALLL